MKISLIILAWMLGLSYTCAQTVTLDEAVQTALENNLLVKAARQEVNVQQSLKRTGFDLPKTNVSLMYGQYNSYKDDNNITLTQTIPFSAFGSQGKLNRANSQASELQKNVTENELVYRVKQVYLELTYTKARHSLLLRQDSIYAGFAKSSDARYKAGETNLLEKVTAESQWNEVRIQLHKNESTIRILRTQLKTLLNSNSMPDTDNALKEFDEIAIDTLLPSDNPTLKLMRQHVQVARGQKNLEAAKAGPDFHVGFFSQTLIDVVNIENGAVASGSDRFFGFQVGLALPLWFVPHQSRVRAAEINKQVTETRYEHYQKTLKDEHLQAVQQFMVAKNSLEYYRIAALPNAELILKQANSAFKSGDINFSENLIALRNALSIQENYLTTLRDYNQSIIYCEYLSGTK